jgi:coenzyme F420-reducing hydrogenase delta subunit
MLPPPFVDFVLSRRLADGVMLAGCSDCDCRYRFGNDWMDARVAGERDPALRARVPRERLDRYWESRPARSATAARLERFREALKSLGPYQRNAAATPTREVRDGAD